MRNLHQHELEACALHMVQATPVPADDAELLLGLGQVAASLLSLDLVEGCDAVRVAVFVAEGALVILVKVEDVACGLHLHHEVFKQRMFAPPVVNVAQQVAHIIKHEDELVAVSSDLEVPACTGMGGMQLGADPADPTDPADPVAQFCGPQDPAVDPVSHCCSPYNPADPADPVSQQCCSPPDVAEDRA